MEPEIKPKKTCPWMSNTDADSECEESECGIWDKSSNQCSIVTIAIKIGNM